PFGVAAREGKLDALVLADRTAKYLALPGISHRLVDEEAAVPRRLRGRDQALGIHAGQDIAKALPFLTDQVFRRHFEIVEEQRIGLMVDHGIDALYRKALAERFLHVDQQNRQTFR